MVHGSSSSCFLGGQMPFHCSLIPRQAPVQTPPWIRCLCGKSSRSVAEQVATHEYDGVAVALCHRAPQAVAMNKKVWVVRQVLECGNGAQRSCRFRSSESFRYVNDRSIQSDDSTALHHRTPKRFREIQIVLRWVGTSSIRVIHGGTVGSSVWVIRVSQFPGSRPLFTFILGGPACLWGDDGRDSLSRRPGNSIQATGFTRCV
jgi:hypothetical protein